LALILAGAIHFWPATLGGSTRLVVVQGSSMEPTFHLGDLIVVRDNHQPHVGDVIVFHIPKGEPAASMLVVHRVIALRPDGSYLTRGDNRTTTDDFHITAGDVVGTPILGIPHAGRAIGIASMPLAVALAAGLVTTLLLWPSSRPPLDPPHRGRKRRVRGGVSVGLSNPRSQTRSKPVAEGPAGPRCPTVAQDDQCRSLLAEESEYGKYSAVIAEESDWWQVELHEDDAYVALDSLGTHEEFFRKAGVGEPLCYELENLALAIAGDLNAQ